MVWTILWFLICIIYIVLSISQINSSNFIIIFSGFLGLLVSFLKHLYHSNLRFYLYWTRFINWFRNYPSKWELNIRYDGCFEFNIIEQLINFLQQNNNQTYKSKLFHRTKNAINFSVLETLNFYLDYQSANTNGHTYDTIDISLSPIEIGCNSSKKKLNNEIIPLLSKLQHLVKPDNSSYVLNISFFNSNPFFNIIIAHLNPSLVYSFNVNLHINTYSQNSLKDIVTVNKNSIILNTLTLHSLKELSNDFIYLSSNVVQYFRASENA